MDLYNALNQTDYTDTKLLEITTLEDVIYHEHLISLPIPQYIVFYNGHKDEPDEMFLKLSDSFLPHLGNAEPVLECKARMLNIIYGHNEALLQTCKRLHDYSFFISEVEQHLRSGYSLRKAIETAINICIEKDILRDILEKQKSEVVSMLLTEYDKKLHEKTIRESERQKERHDIADAFTRLQQGESEQSILASGLSAESVTLAKQLLQSTK